MKIKLKFLIGLFLLLGNLLPVAAQPVSSHPDVRIKNDPILANWDYGSDPQGYIKSASDTASLQSCSVVKPLVLLVKFQGETDPSCRPTTWYDRIVYENITSYSPAQLSQGCSVQNPAVDRSLRQYLSFASYGKFQITPAKLPNGSDFLPSSLGWIQLDQSYGYYANGDSGKPNGDFPQNNLGLVNDAVTKFNLAAAGLGMNLSQFDCNGDNFIDALLVVHSHTGSERSGLTSDLRSQKGKWNLTTPPNPVISDSLIVNNFMLAPGYWGINEQTANPERYELTIGVLAKLFLHNFDLPDLFDVDGPGTGVGQWSLLGDGFWKGDRKLGNDPSYPDAWSRTKLGWLTPKKQLSCGNALIGSTSNSQSKPIKIKVKSSPQGDEYFLLENRQAVEFDSNLPVPVSPSGTHDGLLIWHIDETQKSPTTAEWLDNQNEWYTYPTSHTSSGNYLVALEQADGNFSLERSQSPNVLGGDVGDSFPGLLNKTTFNLTTRPSAYAYDQSTAPGVTVSNISIEADGKIGLSFAGYDSTLQLGDINGDDIFDIFDVVTLIDYAFRGKPEPCPSWVSDINCDGSVNILDITHLINHVFRNDPAPADLGFCPAQGSSSQGMAQPPSPTPTPTPISISPKTSKTSTIQLTLQ